MLRRPKPHKSPCPPRSPRANNQKAKGLPHKRTTAGCSSSDSGGSVVKPLRRGWGYFRCGSQNLCCSPEHETRDQCFLPPNHPHAPTSWVSPFMSCSCTSTEHDLIMIEGTGQDDYDCHCLLNYDVFATMPLTPTAK
jgi:hypothetical protein